MGPNCESLEWLGKRRTHGFVALRLIGDVEPVSEAERERTRVIRGNVTPDAIIRNFLRNEKVAEPMQYVHFQVHAQRKWFPVWFYVDQTTSTAAEVAEDLRKQVATYPSSRDALVDRLAGKDAAFRQSTGKAAALRAKLARGEITVPTDIEPGRRFCGSGAGAAHDGEAEGPRDHPRLPRSGSRGGPAKQQSSRRNLSGRSPPRRIAVLKEEVARATPTCPA
jgi:hypothetical protein